MISSTVRDLPEHRDAIRGACLAVGVMPSMMEDWPAMDVDGVAASLAKVDKADVYVGIFGHRYGYVPSGSSKSVTEMEYDRASSRGIPLLIFLMHEDHPLSIAQVEFEGKPRLEALKERLKRERTVSFFKSAEDLRANVLASLAGIGCGKHVASADPPGAIKSSFDPRNPVFCVPYRPKGSQVVGRDAALGLVRAQLLSGRSTAIGQTASFRGLGGLGKTQLAVEYAYRFRDQYPNGVIWLNADQDIEAQLIDLAERARWVAPNSDHKDKLAIAEQRLKTYSHCLIILDNLEVYEGVKGYLPEPEATPHILVTSRVDHPQFIPVPLDLLDEHLSLQLLTQEAGQEPSTEHERNAAAEIASSLGGLPLALELAGAFVRHRSIGWAPYRDLRNKNLKAALPAKFLSASFTRHESDLYSTLKVNEEILSEEPVLKDILDVLTWSGPGAMGKPLLESLFSPGTPPGLQAALALGVELRLLQKAPGTESYALHRLVREVRREDVPLAGRHAWVIGICERLGLWFRQLKRDFSDLPRYEAEIDHLRAWADNIQRIRPTLASELIWLQAYPPFHRARYQDSRMLLDRARDMLERSGEETLALKADVLTDLCTINTCLGLFTEGRKCGEEALEIRLQLFGEHHSETAMTYHNLGAAVGYSARSGQLEFHKLMEKGLQLRLKALAIWLELNGEDHIDTALALDAVADSFNSLQRFKEASIYAERALAIREKVLGLHPDTATSLSNVGRVYEGLKNYSRALEYQGRALEVVEKVFGAGSRTPVKAMILDNMALVYFSLRDFKKSLEISQACLAMRTELFGPLHPTIAKGVSNVAGCYLEMRHVHQGYRTIDDYLKILPRQSPEYAFLKERRRGLEARFLRPGFRQTRKRRR